MRLPDQINAYQTELIKEQAEKEPCVIVGRCADSVLRDREDCFHVFVFGALGDRAERVVAEHGIDAKAAEGHVKDRDKNAPPIISTSQTRSGECPPTMTSA